MRQTPTMRPKDSENITGTHNDEILFREALAEVLAERAARSGIPCDACDLSDARVALVLRYFDAPPVRARLCLDCFGQHENDAARVPKTRANASEVAQVAHGTKDAPETPRAPVFNSTAERLIDAACESDTQAYADALLLAACEVESDESTARARDCCGASGVELLNGACGDCHKNDAQKANAHVAPVVEVDFEDSPECEACDNKATRRARFAGVMSFLCDRCASAAD